MARVSVRWQTLEPEPWSDFSSGLTRAAGRAIDLPGGIAGIAAAS